MKALFIPSLLLALTLGAFGGGDNWMRPLDGSLSLSQLTIPGTHDSGARFEPVPGTAKCQNLTITEQLEAGVRFLDIRCRHINDGFLIHHGIVYQKLSFTEVLREAFSFLAAHPEETLIMSVQQEHTAENNTQPFEATFDSYTAKNKAKWWLADRIPTLDEARGKVVLFRRFGASNLPKGINASKWPNNTTFSTASGLHIQDRYIVPDIDAKWTSIHALLKKAQTGPPNTLYVNFASGYKPGFLNIPDIPAVSNSISPRLVEFFTKNPSGRFGIILMDFADPAKASLIYATNTPH